MSNWSLPTVLNSLHEDIEHKLSRVRKTLAHPVSKGDGSENAWIELFQTYLPKRYQADKATVVDSKGNFSEQIDIVVFDRQYSPFVFDFQEQLIVPAESVYAVFEVKQELNEKVISYAQDKIKSVRKLHRTSLPIPHAGGTYPPRPPIDIMGGVLSLESVWKPALDGTLKKHLNRDLQEGMLDIGCVASKGYFYFNTEDSDYLTKEPEAATTAFLFKLIEMLQFKATVPMIDVSAYARWIGQSQL